MERIFFILFVSLISGFLDLSNAESCTIGSSGQYGECKVINDCPAVLNDYTKLKKMPTICDSRFRTICCPVKIAATTTTTSAPKRISERKCREYSQFNFETHVVQSSVLGEGQVVKTRDECGHKAIELIVGGTEATEREFPHMALIGYKEGKPGGVKFDLVY